MELGWSTSDLEFREMIRAEISALVPADIRTRVENIQHLKKEDYQRWQTILAERNWATPAWPPEYGGPGWSPLRRIFFEEACFLAGAPRPIPHINMIGPVLQAFGTEAQKERFLPGIPSLTEWWCQGYSEPSSGSDLASLRTAAVRDGDHYIVNGQKTWTSWAHWADYMFCLVRTSDAGRPQEGITFLLIDMSTPGVTVRPIYSLDGAHDLNDVFLQDVRVPVENVVLRENEGWTVAKYLLNAERTEIAGLGQTKRLLQYAERLAAGQRRDGVTLADHPEFRSRLARIRIDLKAHEWTVMRVMAAGHGDASAPSASVLKICGTDLLERTSDLLMDLGGPAALAYDPAVHLGRANGAAPYGHALNGTAATYLEFRKAGIIGGTTEIQKTLIYKDAAARWGTS
ncbi:MAG: acyl-CoA dehydrogenase family protein [Hyphomonadaceae bacterium]|nr:acyl-CoA dehydrogenase family protein [Hyphomonadaceae bacterium]